MAWHDHRHRARRPAFAKDSARPGPAGIFSSFIGLGYGAMAAIDNAVIGVTWAFSEAPLMTHSVSQHSTVIKHCRRLKPHQVFRFHNSGVWM